MRRVLPLLAMLLLGFAPVPPYRPKPMHDDLKAMQGEWVRERFCVDGTVEKDPISESPSIIISGDRLTFLRGRKITSEGAISLGWKDIPKSMDIYRADRLANMESRKAIYQLSAEALSICYPSSIYTTERPTVFMEGQGLTMSVLLC